jgi:uncharacterized membrane protein
MELVNPTNPGQIGNNIGVAEETAAGTAIGGVTMQPGIVVPKKTNYLMYIGIALAVVIVGYMVYKYYKKAA